MTFLLCAGCDDFRLHARSSAAIGVAAQTPCGFSASPLREAPDGGSATGAQDGNMQKRYGVVWRSGSLPLSTGMLELRSRDLRFEGLSGSRPAEQTIAYADLAGVRVGRASSERIDGRATVILEQRVGPPVTLTTVAQPSLLGEIAERLTACVAAAA
jgi:hypothetical protein